MLNLQQQIEIFQKIHANTKHMLYNDSLTARYNAGMDILTSSKSILSDLMKEQTERQITKLMVSTRSKYCYDVLDLNLYQMWDDAEGTHYYKSAITRMSTAREALNLLASSYPQVWSNVITNEDYSPETQITN